MTKQGKHPWSFLAIAMLVIVSLWYGRNLKVWESNRIINHDAVSYYAYLPAVFVYDDIYFRFTESLPEDFEGRIWYQETPMGHRGLKMTMGNAFLWSPFFALAHLYARAGGAVADGYSAPYQAALFLAAVFYLALGLCFLRRLLLRYFRDGTTAVVLVILLLATNLMHYVISEPGMTHVNSFCLFALFLLVADSWVDTPRWKQSALLGLTLGLISLIRPTNALLVILLPFWKLTSLSDFRNRIRHFLKHWQHQLVILAGILIIWTPQLLYWKTVSGHWFYYSYGNEGFFFLKPHLWKGLFSWRKGWLIYTPVMLLSLPGLFIWRKKQRGHVLAISIYLTLHLYVTFSWWCWWYGGSFGSRPMIETYAVLALPLAAGLESLAGRKPLRRILLAVLLAFLIFLNQFQIKQYRISLLHWDSMSWPAYKAIFLKNHWPENYEKLIIPPDYESAKQGLKEDLSD